MEKIILVTGASSGIGKATAEKLISEGHIVYCAARRVEKMEDLKEMGGFPLKMDITKHDTIIEGVNKIIEKHGRIDVLFNNAGFGLYGSVEETSIEDARYQFEVNLFGLAKATQLVLPHMRKQGSGKIINTSSIGGKIYSPLGAWYHATKHAIEGWSDCLRLEVKQFGIDVIIIEPGVIDTSFDDVMLNPMVERSGNGPYKKIVTAMTKSMKDMYEKPGEASPPAVIAEVVSKAIQADHPKTRYVAGKMANFMLFMRKWLPDRGFDWLMSRYMN